MLSPLQLRGHRFTQLHLEAIAKGVPGEEADVETKLSWARHKTNPREWKVDLKVTFEPAKEHNLAYRGSAEVIGFFEIMDGWPDEDCEGLIAVNGASLLYGAIREMIMMMSARSSHGEFLLPTLRFYPPDPTASKKAGKAPGKTARKRTKAR